MNKFKAVFFDIDGTLVSFETHKIPQSTIDAIHQLRAKGIKTIIATGRAYCDITNLGDLEFDGFITANGAYCINTNGEVVYKNLIPKDNLKALAAYQKEHPFPAVFMTEKGNFINYVDEEVEAVHALVNLEIPAQKSLEEILQYDVFQIDAFIDATLEKKVLSQVLTACEGARWHPAFTDVNVKGNNKSTGIGKFLEHFNIKQEETISFGDGGNDIAMIKYTGVGVAMDNANPELKEVADYITDSVDDNGIINALKHFEIL